jgi:hypothetical protein
MLKRVSRKENFSILTQKGFYNTDDHKILNILRKQPPLEEKITEFTIKQKEKHNEFLNRRKKKSGDVNLPSRFKGGPTEKGEHIWDHIDSFKHFVGFSFFLFKTQLHK